MEQSHEGWCKRLRDEKLWEVQPSESVLAQIAGQERGLLKEAFALARQGRDELTLDEVREELREWGNPLGLPSDWVPRAALRTGLHAIDVLVWAVESKAWRLLARPR